MQHVEKEITLSLSYDEYDACVSAVSAELNHLGMCGLETIVLSSLHDKLEKWHDKFHPTVHVVTTEFPA